MPKVSDNKTAVDELNAISARYKALSFFSFNKKRRAKQEINKAIGDLFSKGGAEGVILGFAAISEYGDQDLKRVVGDEKAISKTLWRDDRFKSIMHYLDIFPEAFIRGYCSLTEPTCISMFEKYLREKDVDLKSKDIETFLIRASKEGNHLLLEKFFSILEEKGTPKETIKKLANTKFVGTDASILEGAMHNKNLETIEVLARFGADIINPESEYVVNFLAKASREENPLLLEKFFSILEKNGTPKETIKKLANTKFVGTDVSILNEAMNSLELETTEVLARFGANLDDKLRHEKLKNLSELLSITKEGRKVLASSEGFTSEKKLEDFSNLNKAKYILGIMYSDEGFGVQPAHHCKFIHEWHCRKPNPRNSSKFL